MDIVASPKSAAIAGAWSAFGFVSYEALLGHHKFRYVLTYNVASLAEFVVFLVLPMYFLVIGRDSGPFSRSWFLDAEQRARYGVIVRRVFVWFLSAAAVGAMWSMLFARVLQALGLA
jgi:hypothetical protein